MRTLIFGAGGYLGSHLVKRFVGAGHSVSGFVRNEAAAAKVRAIGAEPVLGDLEDLEATLPLLDGTDTIIYAAQLMLQPEHDTISEMMDRIEGTGKNFIFTSRSEERREGKECVSTGSTR